MSKRAYTILGALISAVLFAAPVSADAAQAAVPKPRTIELATIPALPGIQFSFDGQQVTTDSSGVARISQPHSKNGHRLEIQTPHVDTPEGTALDFTRWIGNEQNDQGYSPVLPNVVLSHNKRIQVGFTASRMVGFSFVDQAHHVIPAHRVSSLTLRSDSGQLRTLRGGESARLIATRPVLEGDTGVAKDVTYYLDSVIVDGANVVNATEQRMAARKTGAATFTLLMRSARFQVKDRFFGYPIKAGLTLTYPDGRTRNLSTDAGGEAGMDNLARGHYKVSVHAPGVTPQRSLSLSRGQYVTLPVLSYVDIAVLGSMLALVVLALAGYGWRLHRRNRATREGKT